jgi:phospholipid transport system substrate-binding protein
VKPLKKTSKVLPHIDFQRIGRWVLGKHWRRANPEQQKRFVEEFRVLLTHTYVTAMVTYLDQIIEKSDNVRYLPMRSTPDADDVTVRTEILLDNNTKVPVNFSMWSTKGGWKIYDVTVDGISLATTYRSSFSSQISRDGLDTLLVRLEEKNNRYTTSNNSNDNSDGNTSNNTGKPVVKASH